MKIDFLKFCVRVHFLSSENRLALGVLGLLWFSALSPEQALAYNGEKYAEVCRGVLGILGGDFGSLLTAAAGVGAIVAAATGGFKAAWTLIVVAIGSFVLKEYTEIWFNPC